MINLSAHPFEGQLDKGAASSMKSCDANESPYPNCAVCCAACLHKNITYYYSHFTQIVPRHTPILLRTLDTKALLMLL